MLKKFRNTMLTHYYIVCRIQQIKCKCKAIRTEKAWTKFLFDAVVKSSTLIANIPT